MDAALAGEGVQSLNPSELNYIRKYSNQLLQLVTITSSLSPPWPQSILPAWDWSEMQRSSVRLRLPGRKSSK